MAKVKQAFFCEHCGYESPKWLGKCPECQSWNSFAEAPKIGATTGRSTGRKVGNATPSQGLAEISESSYQRISTGIGEFDRVLGGGLVPGELLLLAGDPGIGKSTLTMQMLAGVKAEGTLLYISGEESAAQIKSRADRLAVTRPEIRLLIENDLDLIELEIEAHKPAIIILDSIQTVFVPEVTSIPGSLSQLRECTGRIMRWAKDWGIPTVLVGHVTKDGQVAGPRVLEHMVDAVLFFEGERHYQYRILRALKNRFGSTNEIGIFEMQEKGLVEVTNPSAVFLAERPAGSAGSVVVATMEGTRPILVELQALLSTSSFGQPRRLSSGVDNNRMAKVIAVLEKRAGVPLANQDAYLNIIGGLKVDEPALDLGIASAMVSSYLNKPFRPHIVVVGEIGLTGEIRQVNHLERRLTEAAKMGFREAVIPFGNSKGTAAKAYPLKVYPVKTLEEALTYILEG